MTKKNSIGFVCAHPVPILLQNVNSFTLGARSVNPKVKVHVVWTNSWSDPATEAEATKGLIESGVDVLGSVLDSPLVVAKTAEQNHIWLIGSQSDLRTVAPTTWLTGSRWNWNGSYLKIVKSVLDGSWQPAIQWLGMKEGAVELCPIGTTVPRSVAREATSAAEQIKQGTKVIFKGPLKDRDGKLRLAAGQIADAKWLSEMDFFVEGVDGTLVLPKVVVGFAKGIEQKLLLVGRQLAGGKEVFHLLDHRPVFLGDTLGKRDGLVRLALVWLFFK